MLIPLALVLQDESLYEATVRSMVKATQVSAVTPDGASSRAPSRNSPTAEPDSEETLTVSGLRSGVSILIRFCEGS